MKLKSKLKEIIIALIIFVSYSVTIYHETMVAKNMPEKILDTVVYVNQSTGIIIHSNPKYSLVLTAYHTIAKSVDKKGNYIEGITPPNINFEYNFESEDSTKVLNVHYKAESVEVDSTLDLAIVKISVGEELNYSRLSIVDDIRIGDEVYIAANPNSNYRSISKGIVSSTRRYVKGTHVWQISGGVIYGSSGGGAFNVDGELIGIVAAVDMYNTGFCTDQISDELSVRQCLRSAIPYIGYFRSLQDIKNFLFSTEFKDQFNYLK